MPHVCFVCLFVFFLSFFYLFYIRNMSRGKTTRTTNKKDKRNKNKQKQQQQRKWAYTTAVKRGTPEKRKQFTGLQSTMEEWFPKHTPIGVTKPKQIRVGHARQTKPRHGTMIQRGPKYSKQLNTSGNHAEE